MFFRGILQKDGWRENVEVTVDAEGRITAIEESEAGEGDFAIPGFQNTHSHAFQYAMAGIAENHSDPSDDFWSWRKAMYQLAVSLGPEDLESIAAMLYSEMIRHGYTHVVEFHYLHNNKDGSPYDNPAEMALRLVSAAEHAGINITVTPVYYKLGGFGLPASAEQRRFLVHSPDDYLRLVEATEKAIENYEHARLGFGVHSLRAAPAKDIIEILASGPRDLPFHIHISEQVKEVEDCLSFYARRPVEWLFETVDVNERFNLVHATHVNPSELKVIAESGANVALCPTTEGNLGDGIFPLREFKTLGGNWSIGTDSHISLNPYEEIRLLDYGQRNSALSRNTFGDRGSAYAIQSIFDGGCAATGLNRKQFFEIGDPLNACTISARHPLIGETSQEHRLNAIVYAADSSSRLGSIINGKRAALEDDGTEKLERRFSETIRRLRIR